MYEYEKRRRLGTAGGTEHSQIVGDFQYCTLPLSPKKSRRVVLRKDHYFHQNAEKSEGAKAHGQELKKIQKEQKRRDKGRRKC